MPLNKLQPLAAAVATPEPKSTESPSAEAAVVNS
jgi:hypothetical protein